MSEAGRQWLSARAAPAFGKEPGAGTPGKIKKSLAKTAIFAVPHGENYFNEFTG
jgi:hypothetical protein